MNISPDAVAEIFSYCEGVEDVVVVEAADVLARR